MNNQVQIKNLNDLRRYKGYLRHKMKIRQKILNIRLRKVEKNLTVPNITREMFRGSSMEYFMPAVAEYLATKFSGKAIIGTIAGILASIGSIKFFSGKKARKTKTKKLPNEDKITDDQQLFI